MHIHLYFSQEHIQRQLANVPQAVKTPDNILWLLVKA